VSDALDDADIKGVLTTHIAKVSGFDFSIDDITVPLLLQRRQVRFSEDVTRLSNLPLA
jgi:hypothetical protein